ncbi:hypothetical protein LV89_02930 [Arcicella aurantiaca]|uniref:Uncharacterized protein n=1 Tax=Arcicella aurantiaca TaxID=591202 RepID=A0A316E1B3_9BACT|nr:hypothetical protein LV89_02930 [Arcicella aurantiaca]
MFKLLKQEIVQKIYFLLILIVPILCGGIILYNSVGKDIVVAVDGELENSGEDSSFDSDLIDIEEIDNIPHLDYCFLDLDLPPANIQTGYFLLNAYNICLEQKTPPP